MPDLPRSWVSISSDDLTVEIDPLGAQLSSLRYRTAFDLLWNGDAAVWAGRAPLLFPIVGALAGGTYRLGSQSYPLSRHGFARGKLFAVESAGGASAAFKLAADEASLRIYPFEFELDVRYEITGATLSVTTSIGNRGHAPMPASFGYHPGFRWPLPFGQARSTHFIEFESDETAPARRIDSAGLLTPERHPTPITGRRLELADSLFVQDVLIFDQIKSRSVLYGSEGGPRIRVSFPDAPCLGVWTKPGAPFICIEPWHGMADPEGFSGDFTDKPGVFILQAGESLSANMDITLTES
ncbi:MAG TPA: aldose 1-epimerase family protein [Steroidobacteraceae bacterium]|jgi:galactose mutarotase-like enzyme|nr:aldose 1-epimerase family protein [Steroidobacteraceae bacterium]